MTLRLCSKVDVRVRQLIVVSYLMDYLGSILMYEDSQTLLACFIPIQQLAIQQLGRSESLMKSD